MSDRFSWDSKIYENIAIVQKIGGIGLLEKISVHGTDPFSPNALAGVRSILDIGCGTGIQTVYLAKQLRHGTVLGIDLSPAMVAQARELARKEAVNNLTIQELDAGKIEFSDRFDLVISNFALHWIRNAAKLLERVVRSLRSDGTLAVQFPLVNEEHPMVIAMTRAIAAAGLEAHYNRWEFPWFRITPGDYRQLLASKGFAVSAVEQIEDEFLLSKEEFLVFYNAVGLPLYFAGLDNDLARHLRHKLEKEVDAILPMPENQVRFTRLLALARKP